MTDEYAIRRVQVASYDRLTENVESWGTRVYPYQAIAGDDYPYVVYFSNGSTDPQWRQRKDRNVLITFQCISDDIEQAQEGAARIIELFDDVGRQDSGAVSGASPLAEGASWFIQTTTAELEISFAEPISNTQNLHHEGVQIRFILGIQS